MSTSTLRATAPPVLPLDEPLRIFVGTAPDERLAYHVLEHSLRRRSRHRLDVRPIDGRGLPLPRGRSRLGRAALSFARLDIPRRCGRRGVALYLDAGAIALRDVGELFALPFDGAELLHAEAAADGARTGVLLLDCARLAWSAERVVADVDAGRASHESLLHELSLVPGERQRAAIPPRWSSLDRHVEGETALVRYASDRTQPWIQGEHPHGAPWYRELFDALASGAISRRFVDEEVQRGHVAPEVIAWARRALRVRGAT